MPGPPRFRIPRTLYAALAAVCAVPGLPFLALAVSALGDRHGADLLFAGIAAGCLSLSLAFAVAYRRTPPASPFPSRPGGILPEPWLWTAVGIALLAAAAFVFHSAGNGGGDGNAVILPAAASETVAPAPGFADLPAPDTLARLRARQGAAATLFDLEPRAFSASLREAVLGDTLARPPEEPWTGNVYRGRAYSFGATFGSGYFASRPGCRSALLRRFVTDEFRSADLRGTPSGAREYAVTRPLAGDTALSTAGCAEIPGDLRFYRLDTLPGGRTAAWKPFDPWYTLALDPVATDCGSGVQFEIRLHGSGGDGRDGNLIMATRDPVSGDPFPYRRLTGQSAVDPDRRIVQAPEVELAGFDSSRYHRFWIENRIGSIGKEDGVREAVTEADLFCETKAGRILRLGASIHPGPSYLADAWMAPGLLADFDGDGSPDFLASGGYLDTRILFLDGEGIRDSILVSPDRSDQGCC